MKQINIDKVVIPYKFLNHPPKDDKLNAIREYYKVKGKLDLPIALNKNNMLTDGYARYLIAKEIGMEKISYLQSSRYNHFITSKHKERKYIIGNFEGKTKDYIWYVPDNRLLKIGDEIDVNVNKEGIGTVKIKKIFYSKKKSLYRHKSVI